MEDSNNNIGKVNEERGPVAVLELESESTYSANSFFERSTIEIMQHESGNRAPINRFARAEVANLEHRFSDVKESMSCQDDDDTMSRSICSENKRSTVSFSNFPKEVFDHEKTSIEDSFLCKAVLFRGHKDSPQLRFAWYIINAKTKHEESIGRFIKYEEDHHRCSLDGCITFRFKDYLCIMVSHQCPNNEFYPGREDPLFNQRIFPKVYVDENSIQKFLGPIQWFFVRNPDALGIGSCEFTFTFKTSEDCESFKKIITTYRGQPNPEAIAFATPMTKIDRCTIQVCFACLVNQVHNVKNVSSLLYQWNVLTAEEQKDFSKPGNRKKKVMLLLLTIQRRGNVFDFLIEALQYSEKEEEAAKILRETREKIQQGVIKFEGPFPMPDADKKELRRRYMHLTSSIGNKKNILAEMYSRGILTADKLENIMKKKGKEKAEEIIRAAMSFGRRLSDFITILRCTENKHLSKVFNAHHLT